MIERNVRPARLCSSVARANEYGVEIREAFDVSGDPTLSASFSVYGNVVTPKWEVCDPDCRPAGAGYFLQARATAAGAVFRVTAEHQGTYFEATSEPWQGRVTATGPSRARRTGASRCNRATAGGLVGWRLGR